MHRPEALSASECNSVCIWPDPPVLQPNQKARTRRPGPITLPSRLLAQMPGRDYVSAYEAFERSLGDLSYPRTISPRALPQSDSHAQDGASIKSTPPIQLERNFREPSGLLNRSLTKPNAFPPTPPPNATLSEHSDAPAIPARSLHRARFSTPPRNGSLPTPDATPPSLVHHVTPDLSDVRGTDSSRSASFATAKEDLGSQSATGSQVCLPLQGTTEPSPTRRRGLKNLGWGMGSPDLDDESLLPGPRNVNVSTWNLWNPTKESKCSLIDGLFASENGDSSSSRQPSVTFLDDDAPLQHGSPDQSSYQSSWLEESSVESLEAAHTTHRRRLRGPLRKVKPRQSLRTSQDSAIVEATIVDSPRAHNVKGRLRHVSKNLDLRDEASSHPDGNPFSITPKRPNSGGREVEQPSGLVKRSKTLMPNTTNPRFTQTVYAGTHDGIDFFGRSRPASESFLNFSMEDLHYRGLEARKNRQRNPRLRALRPSAAAAVDASMSEEAEANSKGRLVELGASIIPTELQHLSRLDASESTTPQGKNMGASLEPPRESLALRQAHLASPMSTKTDTSDALVVSEAKAVSIYPHNNESLLVIQNPASSSHSCENSSHLKSLEEASDSQRSTVFPSTPPTTGDASHSVKSPLRHPRVAPEPPIANLRSPSPVMEAAGHGEYNGKAGPSEPPGPLSRRSSMLKRARRLSEPFVTFAAAHSDILREMRGRKRFEELSDTAASVPSGLTDGNAEYRMGRAITQEASPGAVVPRYRGAKRARPLSDPVLTLAFGHAKAQDKIGRQGCATYASSDIVPQPSLQEWSTTDDALSSAAPGVSARARRARPRSEPLFTFVKTHTNALREISTRKRKERNSNVTAARSQTVSNGPEGSPGRSDADELLQGHSYRESSTKPTRRLSEPSVLTAAGGGVVRDNGTWINSKRTPYDRSASVASYESRTNEDLHSNRDERYPDIEEGLGPTLSATERLPHVVETLPNASSNRSSYRRSRPLSEPFATFAAAHADVLRDIGSRKRRHRTSVVDHLPRPLSQVTDPHDDEDGLYSLSRDQEAAGDDPNMTIPRRVTRLGTIDKVQNNASGAEGSAIRDTSSLRRGSLRASSFRQYISRSLSGSHSEKNGSLRHRNLVFRSRAVDVADQSTKNSAARSRGSLGLSLVHSGNSRSNQNDRTGHAETSSGS